MSTQDYQLTQVKRMEDNNLEDLNSLYKDTLKLSLLKYINSFQYYKTESDCLAEFINQTKNDRKLSSIINNLNTEEIEEFLKEIIVELANEKLM